MEAEHCPRVLRVTSLQDFIREVPTQKASDVPGPVVRLLNRQIEEQHRATLVLSLQGVNSAGEIVWLCEVHPISWLYGRPFGQMSENVYFGMRELEAIVRRRLQDMGYDVRSGDYGLPDSLKPLSADFECARWVRVNENECVVRPAPEAPRTTEF